ncbi:sulfotransferase [Lysobacter sp. S4-A87]|uniref:tetratricopeptide repeat-containing sulfotransferase family protein n=1 Tax=Lysobacter sp. S4-A87 TaxID=2925843 RepID=UPI001F52C286|nr:sulfotransferase [Lysobacter sp. S4-A87]UNK50372.1 sulfotransferase [Lysobacter sp. S4-A87]
MQAVLSEMWGQAQRLEAEGAWDRAGRVYEEMLAKEPHHVPAQLRMSRLAQAGDRYCTAREHALRAADAVRLKASTRNAGYVTGRLLEFAEEAEVASVILSADWSDPNILQQSAVLAQHLWLAGRYEDALRFLDGVARHVPAHPLLSYTRGNVLRFLGDMAGAEQAYEAALVQSPGFADAHWALATHGRARTPLQRVPRIRQALAGCTAGGVEQAHLLYALFHELDAAGEVDQAWQALEQGAAIMRKRLAYDAAAEAAHLEALMRLPVPTPVAAPAPGERPLPVFIVGMPRTGTTLLDRILGNHGWVDPVGERNDFAAALSQASDHFFRHSAASLQRLQGTDLRAAGHLYAQRMRLLAPGRPCVLDKNPQNLFNIPMILQALPQARILCLRRDPMDACFSNLKELFQGDAYAYSYGLDDLAAHNRNVQRWMQHWQDAAPHAVRVVDYEALVADPETVAAQLIEFLGLPPQAGLSDIARNQAPVATASSSQVREGIHGRGVGAWKRYERQLQPLRESLGA